MNTRFSIGGLFKSADNWLLAVLGVMGMSFFAQTWNYRPSAAMFPRLVSAIVAVLCLYQLGENIWTALAGKSLPGKKAREDAPAAVAWYWVAIAMSAYLALIYIVGFNLATFLFLLAFPPLVGYRRWTVIVPVALVLTVAVALSFGSILHVLLPQGMLGSLLGW